MMVNPGQADTALTLLALLADPKAAQAQLKDLIEATNKHQKALDALLDERKNQKSIEAIRADYEDKFKEIEWERNSYTKSNQELNDKQSILSFKQDELNQRISQFNKYLEDTKASMNDREKTLSEKEKVIETSLANAKSESAVAAALRKSLEVKQNQIKQIVNGS